MRMLCVNISVLVLSRNGLLRGLQTGHSRAALPLQGVKSEAGGGGGGGGEGGEGGYSWLEN